MELWSVVLLALVLIVLFGVSAFWLLKVIVVVALAAAVWNLVRSRRV